VQNEARGERGALGGSKKGAGRVGGSRGREIRRRARVRTRRSTTSVEGAELTWQTHDAEREERGARGNGSATSDPGPRDRERVCGGGTGTDRSAPLGTERGREGAREGELPLIGGVRLSDGAGAWPGWADLGRLGCFILFFFSGFSNSFSISFCYRVFKSKFKLGFKFK
jgi:hypothetical protein